jgi:ATP-dependent RNA helicase DDX55/SPB4
MECSADKALEREQRRTARQTREQTNAAWSNKATRKDERERRRLKKDKKRQWMKVQKQEESTPGTGDSFCPQKRGRSSEQGHDGDDDDDDDEWAQLAREERMAKKVRKGDITQMAFDEEFMS